MAQYLVSTPLNPQYNGKVYGVRFTNGRGFVSEHTIDPSLGYSVEEIVRRMADDFGYEVERVDAAPLVDAVLSGYVPPAEGVDIPDLVDAAKTSAKRRTKASA